MKEPMQAIDIWIKTLGQFSLEELITQPGPDTWSIGQLYNHLILDTSYFLDQAVICASSNNHALEEMSPVAKSFFQNQSFPDKRIPGSPTHMDIPQPVNKEFLMDSLLDLKNKLAQTQAMVANTAYKGKTNHPGLGYFNATEWLQFAEMHFQHHIRQKKRIDIFLKKRLALPD